MDTETVLEIIKIIDTRLIKVKECQLVINVADDIAYFEGVEAILISLGDHLQALIEAQVNAVENQTGE